MDSIAPSRLETEAVIAMNRYGLLFLFIVGILGNSLNVYVFSRVHLRQNTCVLCLLISSLVNLITIIFGIFLRCLIGYNIDLTHHSSIFCKIRFYLIYVSQSASLWLIVFACIDRYISSSMNIIRRRRLNRQNIYRIILFILLFSLLSYLEVFYCVEASSLTNGLCTVKDQTCSFIDTASFLIFNSFLPPSLMLGFGAAMLMNIKQSRQRVGNIQSYIGSINKINRSDKQLISMLLLQVALIVLCMFPIVVMKLYLSITVFITKSIDQANIEYIAYQVSISVSYINSSGMFFIYTLRGKLFRHELIRLFYRLFCYYRQNTLRQRITNISGVHPIERF